MSREATLTCPRCRSSLDETMPVINGFFVFRCGTRYATSGGLGSLKQSVECEEAYQAKSARRIFINSEKDFN